MNSPVEEVMKPKAELRVKEQQIIGLRACTRFPVTM